MTNWIHSSTGFVRADAVIVVAVEPEYDHGRYVASETPARYHVWLWFAGGLAPILAQAFEVGDGERADEDASDAALQHAALIRASVDEARAGS